MAVAVALLVSCSAERENPVPQPETDGAKVLINFTAGDATRAFFDDTATAEEWEKEITSLTVYVYDRKGKIIAGRSITPDEIAARSVSFPLPESAAGTKCSFYAVANAGYGDIATSTEIDALIESDNLDEYNGTFPQTALRRKRTDGFVMTAKTTVRLGAAGGGTIVSLSLKRVVAKIAVSTRLSEDFTAVHRGGKVVITNATVSKAAEQSYSFPYFSVDEGYKSYSHSQPTDDSKGEYRNLFYVYECNADAYEPARTNIVLSGYFDADGKDGTTDDRSDVHYTIYLPGDDGQGQISRNGYYRIDATIMGVGLKLDIAWSVRSWVDRNSNLEIGS